MMNIYCVKNKLNDKKYVGITKMTLHQRFRCHVTAKKCRTGLTYAIEKYGEENFEICLLETTETVESALEREKYWISFLDTYGKNGYNRSKGGQWSANKKPLDYKKHYTKERMEKLRKSRIGCKHSEEAKLKMSEKRKGKPTFSCPIFSVNLETKEQKHFKSVKEAASFLNIKRRSISNVLNGWSKSSSGYAFFYEEF